MHIMREAASQSAEDGGGSSSSDMAVGPSGDVRGDGLRLFYFDDVAEPLAAAVVQRVLRAALTELAQEAEMAWLAERRAVAQAARQGEARAEAEALAAVAARAAERQAAVGAATTRAVAQRVVAAKLHALSLARGALGEAVGATLRTGVAGGWLRPSEWDPVAAETKETVMPALMAMLLGGVHHAQHAGAGADLPGPGSVGPSSQAEADDLSRAAKLMDTLIAEAALRAGCR